MTHSGLVFDPDWWNSSTTSAFWRVSWIFLLSTTSVVPLLLLLSNVTLICCPFRFNDALLAMEYAGALLAGATRLLSLHPYENEQDSSFFQGLLALCDHSRGSHKRPVPHGETVVFSRNDLADTTGRNYKVSVSQVSWNLCRKFHILGVILCCWPADGSSSIHC